MATRALTVTPLETWGDRSVVAEWTGLLNGDDGAAFENPGWSDRSVQVSGTFGAGGTIILEGSNDNKVTWATLTDPQGNALSFTAAKIEQLLEITRHIRPRVTGGDGATDLKVTLLARRG